jgi:HSP20 family protein
MNRLLDDFFGINLLPVRQGWSGFAPAIDVTETPEAIVVKAEIPGMDPKDVDVKLTGNTLVLRGEKRQEKEEKERNVLRVERTYGAFTRTLALPDDVDPEKVQASARNGVLTIEIAKSERSRPKQIQVKVTA